MNDHPQASSPFRTSQLEENDGPGHNTSGNPTMGEIISSRFSRRGLLKGSLAVAAISATVSPIALILADEARAEGASAFSFDELEAGVDDKHHVAPGYDADVLLRWGDPIFTDAPEFDPANQTAEAQARQFGYNNDYVGFIPIDGSSEHGLLVVNHEYTNPHLMFPGLVKIVEGKVEQGALSKEQVDIEMAAHGGTIVEIRKVDGKFQPVLDSSLNRRITANTEMMLTGPAAGHDRLKTNADPSGTRVLGTVNDCAGGVTPWGTYVMAEENIHGYFAGELPADHREAANHERMGVPDASYEWANFYERFDVGKEPNEPNRFGWMVEVDVTDPNSTPKKRTAMGRFKHEGAESIVVPDGRVVFYLGDDERFDYVYKFVTAGRFNPDDRAANMDLLDEGTLYTAKFSDDGSVEWMPLVQGEGPLTAENGFESQADVLIETRRAADLLGATKMDRPEDIQPNGVNGKVYVLLTNNTKRTAEQVDAANPREKNAFGHIIEIAEDGGDFAATRGKWEVLLKCATRRSPRSAPPSRPPPRQMAGSACRTIARSTQPDACGWPPTDRARRPPAAPTACGRWTPRARRAPPRNCSSACRSARNCAVRCSRRTTRRPSWPCSIPATAARTGTASAAPPITRTHRPAGPTSSPTCRSGRRCWRSPGRAAARSACRPAAARKQGPAAAHRRPVSSGRHAT